MGRFARLRSANRALPATAGDADASNEREKDAAGIRARLSELAEMEAPAKELAKILKVANAELDERLDGMESDLLRRFDALAFVELRAGIPRAVESHRREVVSLLEVLISVRAGLIDRLPKVEYLITMLATEEVDGRRNITNDPASITPLLANFVVEDLDASEADAIAMELYQAAALDSDSENFNDVLRSIRARKQKIGLGCLTEAVLRSVVTYNARMFNSVEMQAEASRASDALLEESLLDVDASQDTGDLDGLDFEEESDLLETSSDDAQTAAISALGLTASRDTEASAPSANEAVEQQARRSSDEAEMPPGPTIVSSTEDDSGGHPDADLAESEAGEDTSAEATSVFDSPGIDEVIAALRVRLGGGQVGRRGAGERVAIVLDMSALESIETRALKNTNPSYEDEVIARTAIVGLMVRDVGPVRDQMRELDIQEKVLADDWVRELNDALTQLVSEKLGDSNGYELSSKLSGIKSKHLFKPFNALNAAKRGNQVERLFAGDKSADEMREVAREAASKTSSKRSRKNGDKAAGFSFGMGEGRTKIVAAAALVTLAFGLVVSNMIGISPNGIADLGSGELDDTSEYLKSAYRNDDGRGGLLVGRLDSLYEELELEAQIVAANEMVDSFVAEGIVEAMLYDDRGLMQVHYAEGELLRPREGDRRTGHAPGESARRRSLSGTPLDEIEADEGSGKDGDYWGGR